MINQFDPQNQQLLEGIQGNILKAHGRHHTANLFIRCTDSAELNIKLRYTDSVEGLKEELKVKQRLQHEAKKWLKKLAGDGIIQSAYAQLRTNALFKESKGKLDTGLFANIHISATGYRYLFGDDTQLNSLEESFRKGMKNAKLADPLPVDWQESFRDDVHFMLLLAHENMDELKTVITTIEPSIQAFGKIITIEEGKALLNRDGAGIEHFGYVDGVSQPLFFEDEWKEYKKKNGIIHEPADIRFDPRSDKYLVLVQDPFVPADPDALGSYFVFRKLEQNVKGFKQAEVDLANSLGLEDEDRERTGAMLVGRFEDGTPVEVRGEEGLIHSASFNNFDYTVGGNSKCPFHAHIRKTNPRENIQTKNNLMARRGITYGKREDDPNDGNIYNKPEGGVGLLFMSYQASIKDQFEAIQQAANTTTNGIDPIIGQGDHTVVGDVAKEWNNPATLKPVSFDQFVTLKGGEYFFTPSIIFLKSL